ncbi:MAG: hypothetical protein ACTSRL_02560 [Candidatus Helarchaeota archaeon]
MLDTVTAPFGLLTTDEINITFTAPYVTNELLGPPTWQSVELMDYNVTLSSQTLSPWNDSQYYLTPIGSENWVGSQQMEYNGFNWTQYINSSAYQWGPYKLVTYIRDDYGMWCMNTTYIYLNNTGFTNGFNIFVNYWGDVEIYGSGFGVLPYGYGVPLNLDTTITEYFDPELYEIIVLMTREDTLNPLSTMFTEQDWDLIVIAMGQSTTDARLATLMEPILPDIERAFNIEGMLQEVNSKSSYGPMLAWGMNYDPSHDYNSFLDQFETIRPGNLTGIFSKDNLLSADESYLLYAIIPSYPLINGFPDNLDWADYTAVIPYMKFRNIFNYTNTLNQTHTFSLKNLLGIEELNTIFEQSITYSNARITAMVGCGNFTGIEVYPYAPNLTQYLGAYPCHTYSFTMVTKNGHTQEGFNSTDDIRFNFTAPYIIPEVLTPTSGSVIQGDVLLSVNATMLAPSNNSVEVIIYTAGAFSNVMNAPPKYTFTLNYDPGAQYWSGTWETLDPSIPNGWYDLVFKFTDNLGRVQYDITRVQVQNTYYQEQMNVYVEQNGNVSVNVEMQGHVLDGLLNLSLPEYQDVFMTSFTAMNAYSGHYNYSKNIYTEWIGGESFDYGLSVMVPLDMTVPEALAIAAPIKDDYEQAYGIVGQLSYVGTSTMGLDIGSTEPWTSRVVSYGANYTSSITYDYFVALYHQNSPSGLNNSIPSSTIMGTDSMIQWTNFIDITYSPIRSIPNMDPYHTYVAVKLFYPLYFGANYMQSGLTTRTLSLTTLLGIPELSHASSDIAPSMMSHLEILIENANITSWYPYFPDVVEQQGRNKLNVKLAERNTFLWNNKYDSMIYEFAPFDDINVTFTEPITRPIIITPTRGEVVDDYVDVLVYVENYTEVANVYLKPYFEADFNSLEQNKFLGPTQSMPDIRPPNWIYYQYTMDSQGGGYWNYTFPVYVMPDGPFWFEVVVQTIDGLYSYNNTPVTIANSHPLAINVLTPTDGATLTGSFEIRAFSINSTPILGMYGLIRDETGMTIISQFQLTPEGGDIYSTTLGSYALPNGTYQLLIYSSTGFIGTINQSVIHIENPNTVSVAFLEPDRSLDWASNCTFQVNVSSPYVVKQVFYKIDQEYYSSTYHSWMTSMSDMLTGMMLDPASSWVAEVDTTGWDYMIWDYRIEQYQPAYYELKIYVSDMGGLNGQMQQIYFSDRFILNHDPPTGKPAEITSHMDYQMESGTFDLVVKVTNLTDTIKTCNGEIRRKFDNKWMADISFLVTAGNATGRIYSYAFENDLYEINVFGETSDGKSFFDSIPLIFSNFDIHHVEIVTPAQWDTITGPVTLQLEITNLSTLSNIDVYITREYSLDWLVNFQLWDFTYNPTTGYWEVLWNSSDLLDGNYRIECIVTDVNNVQDTDVNHFSTNNPPKVTILSPLPASTFTEYDTIHFEVQIPDTDIAYVELWANYNLIMNFTYSGNELWTADWADNIGYNGTVFIQVFAYDTIGQVNDSQWIGIYLNKYIPPAGHADIYNATITDTNGTEQTIFNENETVEYHATLRGDAGASTYVITAQTDDPLLMGYLDYIENITVNAGHNLEITFNFTIAIGAPIGIYTVQILVWTDWPWNGGICVDFITITFEVV